MATVAESSESQLFEVGIFQILRVFTAKYFWNGFVVTVLGIPENTGQFDNPDQSVVFLGFIPPPLRVYSPLVSLLSGRRRRPENA